MKQLKDAFDHRKVRGPSRSTLQLMRRFDHVPHDSVIALLRKAGPFKAKRDAYPFKNGDPAWPITEEDARVLRQRYQRLIEPVSILGIGALRTALMGLTFSVPAVGSVGLPIAAVDFVINEVTGDLRNQLLDKIVSSIPGRYGRCGGMAFSAYDFFLVGWPVDGFDVQPASGELRRYIWNRLLDSLEQNALTFFEWVMILHILPVISRLASGALGAAAGSVIGGPLGAAVSAYVAGSEDVLGLGGAGALLDKTRQHWGRLKARLDREAAWPIGFIYGGSANPIDQHQVLAIDYADYGNSTAWLRVWDNNDGREHLFQHFALDFRGKELRADGPKPDLKGIICEEYTFKTPPASLRR
jgi:hypothetical protein